MIHFSLIII